MMIGAGLVGMCEMTEAVDIVNIRLYVDIVNTWSYDGETL